MNPYVNSISNRLSLRPTREGARDVDCPFSPIFPLPALLLVIALLSPAALSAAALPAPALSAALPTARLLLAAAPAAQDNLLIDGGFEDLPKGWIPLWTRVPGGGKLSADRAAFREGRQSARIEHTAAQDWSLTQDAVLKVRPGEVYRYSAWVEVQGPGRVEICVTLRDASNQVLEWVYGAAGATAVAATPATASTAPASTAPTRAAGAAALTPASGAVPAADGAKNWQHLQSRFLIPPGAATMQARIIGYGPAVVRVDDAALTKDPAAVAFRTDLPATLQASNASLAVTLATRDARFSVVDRRTGRRWEQGPSGTGVILRDAKAVPGGMDLALVEPAGMLEIAASLRLDGDGPEMTVELRADGPMTHSVSFPPPFVAEAGHYLILPLNEGISYPVDDPSIQPMRLVLYGGHGLCMAWWGLSDLKQGVMALVETPDDAAADVRRVGGRLCSGVQWQAQKGRFGPPRRIRYVFLDDGGYVAMCKRYRRYAGEVGLLKTLAEKRKENPNVDRLIGAANVWCWDKDGPARYREMRQAGMERVLWSNAQSPENLKALNALGALTSRYDIYQDVMDPANFPRLSWRHGDWPTAAWPDDLMIDAQGQWIRGWEVKDKQGKWLACGVVCDRQAPAYARRRIGQELPTHPYLCRFIDTTTASPWRECYSPQHPVTRSESRHWKMELLRLVSQDFKLVTGSETGHDAAVPYLHYFEGMMSLGPYRAPDAGRNMQQILDQVPQAVAKFQTGSFYRLPLWELAYHDCVVSYWYWGDYNNKLPAVWDRRDLFNALYGTPPMYMFDSKIWAQNRERFAQSYRRAEPVSARTGYSEMLSHRWLSPDHAVQQTTFANGMKVTVNFGDKPYAAGGSEAIEPMGLRIEEN